MSDKPGAKALQAMKEYNKSLVLFKTPKLPKKIKEKKIEILTEEKYIEEMSKIIQRDFFPDLDKLKAQNQYLDAVEKNDLSKLREIFAKYSGKTPTPRIGLESPATFETPVDQRKEPETPDLRNPMSNRSSTSELSDKNKDEQKNITDNHSLDSFLDKYTSEDNNSFQEIIEAADRKLRQKFSVLFEAEEQQAIEMRNRLALPSIEKQFDKIEGPKTVDTWNYKNKNYVMYVPDGVNLTKEEEIEMAKRKQEIVHSNTRLHSNPFDENQSKNTISELAKTQNKGLIGKIGVDGNTLTVSDTPEVRGFSFVKSPSPCPGVAESPLMTWGEIEGTPFRLDGSDTPIRPSAGPSFRIAETTRREVIALELAEKAGERLRGQKAKAIEAAKRNMKSPYVRSSIDRLASMSPAAKRLASMKFGLRESPLTPRPSPGGICKTPNKKSLTPSPMITKKTPVINRKTNTSQTVVDTSITETNTLTDDLLKIPEIKRHRASDFF